ncbi:LytR/AlgR family response regulator transcription factor [Maribacter halichondriae]|uniref:LytR/AlgR family response regulator transcription factor n=1 Tax=Maribacter halichondriae TaxID=2980554 RepID=UPI0023581E56|nr:LytTR family DNA-binding domain-containing protein [Maribacter sp. Hal144]
MEKLKCIIVDDEPPAIRLLEKYLAKVTFLELVGTTSSALEALSIAETTAIDLIFLDIQMPDITGIQLSKLLKGRVKIIFTTAYPQFALESYGLNAVDYLLKPFEFERFYEAVLKVKDMKGKTEDIIPALAEGYLFVKTNGKNNFEKVFLKEIIYIESLKNYLAIHLRHKQIITYSTLKHLYEYLPTKDFIQIHRSYLVALQHIEKTDSLAVFVNNTDLPIGETYKSAFFKAIEQRKF